MSSMQVYCNGGLHRCNKHKPKAKLMAATVNQPIVGETLISTYKPTIKIGGS
jgi:hypothetical protein